jgi:hypothetical protein
VYCVSSVSLAVHSAEAVCLDSTAVDWVIVQAIFVWLLGFGCSHDLCNTREVNFEVLLFLFSPSLKTVK